MRIYFIHVYRRHWEFYPEDEREDAFEEDDPEAGQRTWLHLIKRSALRAWRSVEGAESGMRLRIRRIIERLNKRVDPTEPMLRRIRHAPAVEITYPSGISEAYVRRRLRLLLLHKTHRHRRGIYLNAALIPLTAAMGLFPGPNVFLAWNGYRLFSHIRAWHGGQRVLNGQVEVVFKPSDELDALLAPEERLIKPLDHSLAHTIGQQFKIPGLVDYLHRTGSLTADEQV
jgi:hypothetical protein